MAGRNFLKQTVLSLASLAAFLLPVAASAQAGPAFKLTTPATFPTTAAGSSSATQTLVLTTTRAVTISSVVVATTVNSHQEFTVGTMTGCTIGSSSASGATCSIPVTFSPFYTGIRQQPLTITDSTGLVYTVGLQGLSIGPQTLLTPTSANTNAGISGGAYFSGDGLAATSATVRLGYPEGVFIDASNNIYYADFSTHNIRVIYQSGTALACLIEIEEPALFGLPAGATSCAGATSAPVAGSIYTIAGDPTPYVSSTSTHLYGKDNAVLATAITSSTSTLDDPSGVAVDAAGNVIVVNYGNYVARVIYSGGDSMACLIEVENPTLFGLSSTATSCTGATSAPIPGYIYTIAGSGTAGITGDGAKATAAAMANLYAVALSKDGDIYIADDSVQAARTARIRVVYNGGAQAAALITATNPGTTPVYGNIYKVAGGVQSSSGDGGIATSGGLLFSKGVAVDGDGDVLFTDYNGVSSTTFTNIGKVRVIYNGGATMGALITKENPGVTPIAGYLYTIAGNGGTAATPTSGNGGLASAAVLDTPYGVTVDAAGDIFVADYTDRTIRKIQSSDGNIYAYAGTSNSQAVTNGNSITTARFWDPFGIALGSSGTVVIGEYGVYRVRNVDITPAAITFPTAVPKGSTGSPTYVYFLNQGNQAATIASVVASTNFTTLAIDTTVSLYSKDCTKITTLAAGDGCAVAVALQPTIGGNITGTLTITDNSSNQSAVAHTVSLTGVSALQTQVALTSSVNPTYAGNSVTYTAVVSVASGQDTTGAPALIGTVTFTDGTATLGGGPITIDTTTLTASVTVTGIAAGTHAIKAVYTPDSTVNTSYSSSTGTLSEVATAVATTTTVTSSNANADLGANVTLTAAVAAASGSTIPTGAPALAGAVTFNDTYTAAITGTVTTTVLASNVTVTSGVATFSSTTLGAGTHAISVVFTPSSVYYASSTGTFSQVVSNPGFTPSTNSYGVAVQTGSSVTVPFSIASVGGYKGTVTGSCSSLPANITCSFAPSSTTFTGTDNTATVNVNVSAVTTTASNVSHLGRTATELAGILGAAFLLFLPRRRRLGVVLMAIFTLALSAGLTGCSNSVNATRGTFNINVTFTDGSTSYTTPITVSVLGNPGN